MRNPDCARPAIAWHVGISTDVACNLTGGFNGSPIAQRLYLRASPDQQASGVDGHRNHRCRLEEGVAQPFNGAGTGSNNIGPVNEIFVVDDNEEWREILGA